MNIFYLSLSRPNNHCRLCLQTINQIFLVSTGAWETITHFALFDAAVDGNILGSAELAAPLNVVEGKSVQFGIGALTLTAG